MCRSVKVVKPIHCDALYGFDKDYFFFLCCSCLALFYICNVIQTSDLDKDDSASGPLLRFVSAMVMVCKCHGYGSQVPWLRWLIAIIIKKGCLEWFVSRQPFVFYSLKAMLAYYLWLALVLLVASISLSCGKH